jgi:pimeloyl-ACP methyl ester carboxylesterase
LKAYLDDESNLNASLREFSKYYARIDIPVVILTGDHDGIVSAKENAFRLKAVLPRARRIEIKGAGHEIPQTHPESINRGLSLIRSPVVAMTR